MSLQRIFYWVSLTFIFLECTDKQYLIKVPNIPYSLATILFVITGLANFPSLKTISKNRFIILMGITYLSIILAALLSDYPIQENLSPAIGSAITFVASIGFAYFIFHSNTRRILDIYFLFSLCYWSYYIVSVTVTDAGIVSYSEVEDVVNHHISAFLVSLSGLYFIFRGDNSALSLKSALLVVFIVAVLLLSESRSNLVVFILTYVISFAYQKRSFVYSIIIAVIFLAGIGYNLVFSKILENELIQTRFDVTNTEYIETTNISRIELYNEFIPTLKRNPFGKGAANPKVNTIFGEKLMHNKYASLIITGGALALISVILLIWFLIRFNLQLRQQIIHNKHYIHLRAITFVLICFYLTLLTVDVGGLRYHLFFSFTLLLILQDQYEQQRAAVYIT